MRVLLLVELVLLLLGKLPFSLGPRSHARGGSNSKSLAHSAPIHSHHHHQHNVDLQGHRVSPLVRHAQPLQHFAAQGRFELSIVWEGVRPSESSAALSLHQQERARWRGNWRWSGPLASSSS